jgi:miniconductance mechanosensitive channel
MVDQFQQWLLGKGLEQFNAELLATALALFIIMLAAVILNLVVRQILLGVVHFVVSKSETKYDDVFLKRKMFDHISHYIPALGVYLIVPIVFSENTRLVEFIIHLIFIYIIIVSILVLNAFLKSVQDIYQKFEVSKEVPIKGIIQVLQIVVYFVGLIFFIALILDKSPFYLLSGLGALTAILLLVFKDVILGFVAGIQLAANKMVMHGDWIEMSKYGADGPVIDIALTTVKVQNWDKTITTIPTYALISDSFKNWRGMQDSGGRRIKRSVLIDISSIKFCDEEMIERFSKIRFISAYVEQKKKEVAEYNSLNKVDTEMLANRRRLTNVGTFRAYVVAYLKNHPNIRQDMTFLVRQLKPTEMGLPLEIYVFVNDIVWANYEAIQADIFDHILAIAPEFDLYVFQNPSGMDFRQLKGAQNTG